MISKKIKRSRNVDITVVLPTYNGEKYLAKAIESVLSQSFDGFELIIINDCSTDDTEQILDFYAKNDKRISVITNTKNQKLPTSLNLGFEKSVGRYLTWISDDNQFKPNALKFMFDYLENHRDIDLISCAMDKVEEVTGCLIKKTDNDKTRQNTGFLAAYCNVGGCFLYRRDVFDTLGGYDTSISCGEDYDYWCRVALLFTLAYSCENYFTYTIRKGAMSETRKDELKEITSKIHQKYSEKILAKYTLTSVDLADTYYQMFKSDLHNTQVIQKAFRANFLRSMVKFGLYYFRQLFHKV